MILAEQPSRTRSKRVIVAGAGIGGLCCALKLMERGHDVTVLEASGRPGGHVNTIHDPLPDGLYADVGAEHFTKPGYEPYWKYVKLFNLPAMPYPRRVDMLRRIDGKWYTEEQLQESRVLNLETGDPAMYLVYQTADEVPSSRGVLMGSGRSDVSSDEALTAFRRFYPGKAQTVEQAIVHNWAKDPWAFSCERLPFPLGQLKKFWPHIHQPVGRIHFAGSFADNLPWGMDAATCSVNRVADTIDRL